MSVGPWDTSPLSVHARWPGLRGLILQNKIRDPHEKQGTSCGGSTSRQTMEACHSRSDPRGTSVFSWPPTTNAMPPTPGLKPDSLNSEYTALNEGGS